MSDAPDGPDTRRALLAVVCALGLVTAAAAAPALADQTPLGGLDSPPAPNDVPDFVQQLSSLQEVFGDAPSQSQTESGTSAFGALTPGSSTDVGGSMSAEQQQNSASAHFLAEADGPRYWRTNAYTTYTGSGWERKDVNRVQAPRPVEERPSEWNRVTLREPASSLPTPWRPTDLDYDCGDGIPCSQDVTLTATRGIEASPAFEAGASYRVQSVPPVDDPDVLRDTPVDGSVVSTEYTSVETTDRVEERAAEVVGDADNRYEAAKAVEEYLESEKTYSLTDVPEPGDHITDQFLFEQSAGYCEYFATAMTVMLRSENVPARYVVGYQGGERVGSEEYLVRGADAHAWVEVYFEDVGWVRFDPTPGGERSNARDDLHADDPDFEVSLNQTAVPGEDVTANVTAGGAPADDVTVAVNGEHVGETDDAGQVTFTVPYAEELNVTVRPADDADVDVAGDGNGTPSATGPNDIAYNLPPPRFDGGDGPNVATVPQSGSQTDPGDASPSRVTQDDDEDNGTTQNFPVSSQVQFSFDDDVEPGAERTLSVRVAGKPFAQAAVSVAGVDQGRTGEDGEVTVQVPENASGVINVTATRADLSETTTYPVDSLSVDVSPSLLAPLPGTDATARVTAGDEPVADAAVGVAGETVGTTDSDGRVQFSIPLARAPAVVADASSKQATTHVDWVLPSAAAAVLVGLGVLAAVATAARRRGVTLQRVVAAAVAAANEVVSLVVNGLVGAADALEDLAAEFREAAGDGWRGVLAWLASLPGRVRVPAVGSLVASVAARVNAATSGESANPTRSDAATGELAEPGRLQSVWRQFVAAVGVEHPETKTPGEVAREAVRRGYPEKPVYAVTNAFRDVAYGDRAASRLERGWGAISSLGHDDASPEDGDEQ